MPLLTCTLSPDRASIDPSHPNRIYVVCDLTAKGDAVERERLPLDCVLSLDVSGSMQGPPIEQVIASVERLVDLFQETDRVGIVAFSAGATRVCGLEAMTDAGKRLLRSRARRLEAEGGTAMEAGLVTADEVIGEGLRENARRAVLLLSDGAPNVGASTPEALAAIVTAMRKRLSVSTLGYGASHNEDVLARVADAGGGRYFFVQDPQRCQHEFAMAIGTQADMVVDGVEIAFKPAEGVRIVRVIGAAQSGVGADGLSVAVGDLTDGQRRYVAVELEIDKLDPARLVATLLSARATYRRAGTSDTFDHSLTATIELRQPDAAPSGIAACAVLTLRAEETRVAARQLADRGQWEGAAATIRKFMGELEASHLFVKNDGSELAEVFEMLLDEAMAYERRPNAEQYQQFRKDAVRSTLYTSSPQSKRQTQGKSAQRAIALTAGIFPEAYLVRIDDPQSRHALGAQCTIGRTADADIAIVSDRISRRHAEVYALHGEFWICDLGSTNTTAVNGQNLGTAPHKLEPGDVVDLGGVQLRYEEKKP